MASGDVLSLLSCLILSSGIAYIILHRKAVDIDLFRILVSNGSQLLLVLGVTCKLDTTVQPRSLNH